MKWATWLFIFSLPVRALAAELTMWHAYRGDEEAALEKVVQHFTQQSGISVDLLFVPFEAYSSKLSAAIPHGVGPDVFIFAHERLRQFENGGLVAPTEGELSSAVYSSGAIEALQVDSRHFGYPLSVKCLALYVNKRLVPTPPRNTQELLRLLPSLSRPTENRFGLAYEAGDFYFHAPFVFGFGGQLFDENGRANFSSTGMTKSLEFILSLQTHGYMPQEASGALVTSLFKEGRVAMVISGPWLAGEISPNISYEVVPLPQVTETGLPLRPFLGVEAAFVSAHSQKSSQAQRLARFLSEKDSAVTLAQVGHQIPANLQALAHPEIAQNAFLVSFQTAAQTALATPNTEEMSRVWEPMKLALRGVLQGTVSPKDAAALAERRYRALYRATPKPASQGTWAFASVLAVLAAAWRMKRNKKPSSRRYPEAKKALAYLAPAATGIVVLILVPLTVGFSLAFFHHARGSYTFVGLSNFFDILASRGYRITEPLSFYFTLAVTLLWTLVNVVLHVSIGLGLALLLKHPLLKLRGFFRVLLIVPWAVPNYITALTWKGMFHQQFGAINGLLQAFGIQPISWFTHWATAFSANVITNTWLGFPFMMVVALGALQSIPQELYEAAQVDGASKWMQFRHITLPLLRPALLPAVILGSVWTFNMFNVIYLVSGGDPGGGTDILVSESFRWAFQRNEQYGFAAAYSVLIFIVLLGWSFVTKRLTQEKAALA